MKFNKAEILSPFNLGDLKKGEKVFAADNIKDLRQKVVEGNNDDIYEFNEYTQDEDLPFKTGKFGVSSYRYAYRVNDEEMLIHSNDWLKYL